MNECLHNAGSLPEGNHYATGCLPAEHLPLGNGATECRMDSKREHRRLRYIELLDAVHGEKRGRQVEAARKISREPNYISRLISGGKAIGEELQDVIEDQYNLTKGWLDLPLGTAVATSSSYSATQPEPASKATESPPAWGNTIPLPKSGLERAIAALRRLPPAAQEEAIGLIFHVQERYRQQNTSAGL